MQSSQDYKKLLWRLYTPILKCLFRKDYAIDVSVNRAIRLAYSEVQSVLTFLPRVSTENVYFHIKFDEEVKLFILRTLKYSPLGVEIFGDANTFPPSGMKITWDNHNNNNVICEKFDGETGELLYTIRMKVVVDIIKQNTTITVDWKTIKFLLPKTGLRMCVTILAVTKIHIF